MSVARLVLWSEEGTLLRVLDAGKETELHPRHRGDGGLCPPGCVKPVSEQSPWKCPCSSSRCAVCAQLTRAVQGCG